MDRHLEQLISEAARGLEAAEGFGTSEQMDFTGFAFAAGWSAWTIF